MSRSSPELLATLEADGIIEYIIKAEAMYAIYYKGQPVNLKTNEGTGASKYRKVSFPNPGHAMRLAKKLNLRYKTLDFAVYTLNTGEAYNGMSKTDLAYDYYQNGSWTKD